MRKQPSKYILAYFAGFFDGEGCIVIASQARVFLEEMLPYLKLKKPEAEIAIRWQSERKRGPLPKGEREKANIVAEAQRIVLSGLKRQEVISHRQIFQREDNEPTKNTRQ